jgi:hypothetical protein
MRVGMIDRLFVISLYIADGQTNTFHDGREANNGAKNGAGRVGTSKGCVRGVFVALCGRIIRSVSVTDKDTRGHESQSPSVNDPGSQPDVLKA